MKKWIFLIIVLLMAAMIFSGCVKPGSQMNVTTPQAVKPAPEVDTSSDAEPQSTPEPTAKSADPAPQNTESSGQEDQNGGGEAVAEVETTLDEVVELLDELDSILNESFD